jgi:hypothetical protein
VSTAIADTPEPLRPFSSGFEHRAWTERNCAICPIAYDTDKREWRCTLEAALDLASITDGTITRAIADRMGYNDATMFQLGWPCQERLRLPA